MESRRALRNFYKLPSDTASETASNVGSEFGSEVAFQPSTIEDVEEEEQLTQLDELDAEDADIPQFVQKLVHEKNLTTFTHTVGQIRRERAALASAQQELVNDNYKRLIHAAEALEYLSGQGDLASVKELSDPVNRLADFAKKMSKLQQKGN